MEKDRVKVEEEKRALRGERTRDNSAGGSREGEEWGKKVRVRLGEE